MDPITSATFLLLILSALGTALMAVLLSLPQVASSTVQETYVYQLRSILAPQLSITTASGLRAFRMSLPLPERKAARFTGLRAAQVTEAKTLVEVPAPELLASTKISKPARGIGGQVAWLAGDVLSAQPMPRGVALTAFQGGMRRTFAEYVDSDGDAVVVSRLVEVNGVRPGHVFAVPVVVPYLASAPTAHGKHLGPKDTGQENGMLGSLTRAA